MAIESFSVLAAEPAAAVDELALALAAEFKQVDAPAVRARLDQLGAEVALERDARDGRGAGVAALREVLGGRYGFRGERDDYDHPDNSMLDLVLERRRGLPIALSVLYVATARRARIALTGIGLPGHYVVGDLGADPPLLLDPFAGGTALAVAASPDVRPWDAHETALRMLNNLVGSYGRRGDLGRVIRAAELRLALPLDAELAEAMHNELRSLRARLN